MKTGKTNALFITASDTNVGKTYITCNLLRLLLERGENVRAIKPIETGFDYSHSEIKGAPIGSDVACYQKINPMNNFAPAYYPNYPASPHYSARLDNLSISIDHIEDYCHQHISESDITLIEGAGGLLVPFNQDDNKTYNFTHLLKRLNVPIALVINNKLGAINQALINIQLCQFHGIKIACVVMNQTDHNDPLALENISFIQSQTTAPVIQIDKDGSLSDFNQRFKKFVDTFFVSNEHAKESANLDINEFKQDSESTEEKSENFSLPAHESSIDHKIEHSLTCKLDFDKNHIWHPYTSMIEPLKAYHVSYAEGKYLYVTINIKTDVHVKKPINSNYNKRDSTLAPIKLLDGMSSWWAVNLGYNRDVLNTAAIQQINKFSHVMFGGLTHDPAIELGKALKSILPEGLEHIFYTDSGSVSVEVAIKMALQYQQVINPKKTKVLTPLGGYHGDTFGAMSVCDPVNGMHGLFQNMLAEQIFIPRPECRYDFFSRNLPFDNRCLQPLTQAVMEHKDSIACVIIEPVVQGAGGMWLYHPEYLRHLRRLCDEHDIVLIFDEIATGFGRTGEMFASKLALVTPDIICLGKALTGGFMSFATTVANRKVAQGISINGNPFMHGPTFMGNPLACAVAKAAIDSLIKSDWKSQVTNIESWLSDGLASCLELPAVADVRVLGAIGIVEMVEPVDVQKIQVYFVSQGVWIRPFGKLIYTMPHFNFNQKDIEHICGTIYGAIESGEY